MLREIIECVVNEGTQASIIVKTGPGKYSMSYAQYDGYLEGIGVELKKYFTDDKKVKELVSGTGEIRGIKDGKIEFYKDRPILIKNAPEDEVLEEANYFSTYKYLWDPNEGKWFYTNKKVRKMADIKTPL